MNLEGKPVAITRKSFLKSSLDINTICSHTFLLFLQVFHSYKICGGRGNSGRWPGWAVDYVRMIVSFTTSSCLEHNFPSQPW